MPNRKNKTKKDDGSTRGSPARGMGRRERGELGSKCFQRIVLIHRGCDSVIKLLETLFREGFSHKSKCRTSVECGVNKLKALHEDISRDVYWDAHARLRTSQRCARDGGQGVKHKKRSVCGSDN